MDESRGRGYSFRFERSNSASPKSKYLIPQSQTLWNSRGVLNFFRPRCFFGLLVRPTDFDGAQPNRYITLLQSIWQKLLILIALFIAFMDTWKSVARHKDRLTSLEFTAMAIAFHRLYKVITVVIMAVGLGQFSREMHFNMREIEKLNCEFWDFRTCGNLIRQNLSRMAAICWGVACGILSAGVVGAYATFQRIGARSAAEGSVNFTWSTPLTFPIVPSLPTWAVFIAYSFFYSFIVGILVLPQLLVLLSVYPLGLWFEFLAVSIKTQVSGTASPDRWTGDISLSQIAAHHWKLTKVVAKVDRMFRTRCGLLYLNDLIGFIATVSLLLRHKTSIFDEEHDLDLLPLFLTILGSGIIMVGLRTGMGVWMNEKAHAPPPLLYEMHLHCKSEEDKHICTAFTSRLQGFRVALTVGGFFYMNRDFIITISGILLTYVLFVYQMQDQKEDLSR